MCIRDRYMGSSGINAEYMGYQRRARKSVNKYNLKTSHYTSQDRLREEFMMRPLNVKAQYGMPSVSKLEAKSSSSKDPMLYKKMFENSSAKAVGAARKFILESPYTTPRDEHQTAGERYYMSPTYATKVPRTPHMHANLRASDPRRVHELGKDECYERKKYAQVQLGNPISGLRKQLAAENAQQKAKKNLHANSKKQAISSRDYHPRYEAIKNNCITK
eukprot:TRINITY_DN1047_c0_g4_i4.p1 TRINITY_DN1047_c0_g4~~TRINITY_DN1047_c0_g4_i4.p1  ORF type:complete len:233 (-),score=47.45 TRINITY_DN1047_c0_g4_i4:88-741(-)